MPTGKFSARKKQRDIRNEHILQKKKCKNISVLEMFFFPNRNYDIYFVFITETLECYKCEKQYESSQNY